MAAKEFPEYKYGTGADYKRGLLTALAVVSTIITFIVAANFGYAFFALFFIPILLLFINRRLAHSQMIFIGGRYLIVGDEAVYYKNILKTELDSSRGILTISTKSGRNIKIKADNFPTNARKPNKIKINREKKFNKAVKRIMEKVK